MPRVSESFDIDFGGGTKKPPLRSGGFVPSSSRSGIPSASRTTAGGSTSTIRAQSPQPTGSRFSRPPASGTSRTFEDFDKKSTSESKSSSNAAVRSQGGPIESAFGGVRKVFTEGQKVKVKKVGLPGYEDGVIYDKNIDGTYNIKFSDGRIDKKIIASRIALPSNSSSEKESSSESKSATPTSLKTTYKMGDKIEGNLNGKGRWYPGRIVYVNINTGLVDIKYDDGDEESSVPERLVRKQMPAEITVPGFSSPGNKVMRSPRNSGMEDSRAIDHLMDSDDEEEKKYKMGENVEVRRDGGLKWLPAKIVAVNMTGSSYDVRYTNDGNDERRVQGKLIRSLSDSGRSTSGFRRPKDISDDEMETPRVNTGRTSGNAMPSRIEEGSKVEGNYRGKGKWFPGKITRDRGDHTFDIAYDDGESETRVDELLIRLIGGGGSGAAPALVEGSSVEALYKGKKWYPGKITRVRLNGTFDISYDDGEKEVGVLRDNVRAIVRGLSPRADREREAVSNRIEEGSKVEGNYRGKGKWFPGKITRDRGDHTFDIAYDDGESETRVDELLIRLIGGGGAGSSSMARSPSKMSNRIEEGSKVEGNYRGKGKWFPGKITRDRGDHTFDIAYDDGESETRVDELLIRLIGGGGSGAAPALVEGSSVEALYKGKKWYPGKITRVRLNGTFDISYDDGEKEVGVLRDNVRAIVRGLSPRADREREAASNRIEEGSKVEGNYRGKGKWFPGKITRDRGDHTFDIAYDDGESETRVDELLIRLIGGGGAGSSSMARSPSKMSNRIEEGSKVEGNYRGKGKWFAGKITRDRGDHTFDIAYDDGESETRVDELLIRLIGGGGAGSGGGSKRIEEGSKVEGNYRGKGKWFPGKITRDRGDHTFDIAYDDGESETRVDELLIRLIGGGGSGAAPALVEGSSVEALYKGKKWFPGKITRVRLNGTFDISYDDGEKEVGVLRDNVRAIVRGLSPRADREREAVSNRIEEGSKVEGNYRGKGKWFPGKITRDRGDHTFDIAYDDGESETRVDELLIRLIGGGGSGAAPALVEGSSVEALYKGKKWYPGKITRVRLNGTFDISYDDGEKEVGVLRDNVRAIVRGLSPRADRERETASNRIEEGSKVEGNYRGKGKWFPGKITRDRGDHTFDIAYDDGESETRVDELLIRLIGGGGAGSSSMARSPSKMSNRIEEGSKVEGNYRGKGKWFPGKITRDRGDHTFDIAYDDGESETRVDELLIRLIGGGGAGSSSMARSPSKMSNRIEEGSKVEGNYRGKGKWFPGKITRDRGDHTFDIAYDDGESETRVDELLIRLIGGGGAGSSSMARSPSKMSNRIEEGSEVEGNYRGKGKWFPGKITRDRGDHTFDIAYDDGESETRVDELLIRLIGGGGSGAAPALVEGSSVEALYKGKKWYRGKITRVRLNGTFDISYDDGEKEVGVLRDNVRAIVRGLSPRADRERETASNRIEEGSKVEGNYRGKGKWFPGKITRDRGDHTFDIAYDDGESETRVDELLIRLIGGGGSGAAPALVEGSSVEALYKGKKWYPGKITRVRLNGTFDISYDDGEKEVGVLRDNVRAIVRGLSPRADREREAASNRIEEGSKVEGNYRGKGKWFPGKITRDRGDHTFDIAYDDGESETRVDELLIRLIGGGGAGSSSMARSPSKMSNRIEEGSKVEGNYRGKGKWFPGKITRDRGDHTFDIAYDDGESETRVDELLIRLIGGGGSGAAPALIEGSSVEALYKGKKWYPGKITRVRLNGTFDISYDDGEKEVGVLRDNVRAIVRGLSPRADREREAASNRIEEGSKVEGNYRGKGKWFPGKITRDRGDHTFDIAYDDGESETRVDELLIRLIGGGGAGSSSMARSPSKMSNRIEEGSKVEGNYRGKGKWFPGKITRDRGDHTFDIAYDDGESETRVDELLIRLIGGGGAGSSSMARSPSKMSNRIEEGSKVEGNYRGKGKWFPGKITRDRGDHTFDIAYDDGESETRVDELLIRLIGGGGAGSGGGSRRIEEGSKVEGNYRGKGKWFPGKITRDRGDHTFDIAYDDGESETRVDELLIRLIGGGGSGAAPALVEGSSVEALYKGKKWYPGKITRVRLNGTFDISYDDGEKEVGVLRDNVRAIVRGLSPRADREREAASNRIEEGSKVEGNYRGKGKWFPGKITRDRGDHTFDIAYDDGESETRVDELLIRLIGGGGAGGGGGLKRIEEGSKVEGNYRGKGKWFPGKITRDRGDHTFDIAYDDGESETRVDELLIRLIGGGGSGAAPALVEGSSVEALYKGKKWYPGKITRVRLNGTFDISYDDGEKESGVLRDNVRAIVRGLSPRADRERETASNRIEEGSKVEGNYRGKGKWFPGKITRDRGDHTFDIAYDDGESETRVDELLIRLIGGGGSGAAPALVEGSSVEALYKGKKWYPGKITRVRLNGTFDISYDDGEKESGVLRDNVRAIVRGLSPRADRERETASNRIEEGSKVEGNYRGKGKWFPGKITRDRGDHTFDIAYDDGESETRVDELLIRLIGGGGAGSGGGSNRIEEGSKVEGNYRGKGKWFPGKITRDRGDHTFDIAYDDGESETRVDELLIRLIGGGGAGSGGGSKRIEEGSKVEGNYRGKGKWFPGKITRDRGDHTFDIAYDDGESETRVDELLIRLIGGGGAGSGGGSKRIEEGSKVEGNYRGKGKWFPGKITRGRGDHTFDIAYDDGESETRVDELLIRLIGGGGAGSGGGSKRIEEGSKVEGNYRGKGKWFPGKITRDRGDHTFDIAYDDGESETRVDELLIRLIGGGGAGSGGGSKRIEEGSKVEGNYRGKGKWFPGKITRDRGDHTFDIAYDDGESETRVDELLIRLIGGGGAGSGGGSKRIEEGSKVEGNYRGKGKWFPGKITRDRGDHTFDIAYDDGESETRVDELLIRLIGGGGAGSGGGSKRIEEGSKVEGNYRGKGKWFPGKITRDRGDHTFDIAYDDGESETRVDELLIRLIGGGGAGSGGGSKRIEEGSKVEGNYRGKGKWFPGKITRDRGDHTFDIAYDDGESETRVDELLIRLIGGGGAGSGGGSNRIEEGSKVEGNYRGKGKWFPGKITRDRGDHTFDIAYDDGESETRVDELLIRLIGGGGAGSGGGSNRIEEGSKVEGNYRGKGKWFPGKITRDRGDHTFDIAYDDGESETRVDELLIRLIGGGGAGSGGGSKRIEEGSKVEGNYRGKGKWFPGKITRDRGDHTFDIAYDDGESETRVDELLIRLIGGGGAGSGGGSNRIEEGSKVEGNYRGKGKWFPGKITRDRGDHTFDIAYDDGESETRVDELLIRLIGGGGAGSGGGSKRIEEGSKVEGNYRGKGKWFPGKITRDRGDHTFDIAYDDGESETRVDELLIRLIGGGGAGSGGGSKRIEEGSKVEGNYRGKGKWFPGKITRDRGDHTFDIAYDDGESETRVDELLIRLIGGGGAGSGGGSKRIEEGSKVEGNYRGKGKWFPGKITRDRGDHTFDIAYDDGESETRVDELLIRLIGGGGAGSGGGSKRIEEGSKVEGNYRGKGKWFPGKITRDRGDHTFDIAYDDGESETRVDELLIRLIGGGGAGSGGGSKRIEEGSKVEGNYRGKGKWFPGKITRDRGDHTFDIAYDDGESETRVDELLIRLIGGGGAGSGGGSKRIEEGSKVEGNYRGKGKWFPGKITRDRGDHTFDIAYDDGESETRVDELLIRLIGGGGAGSGGGSKRIEEGSKVEGNYRGKGKWFPGKITRDRGDHTFDIAYDDGESETQVDELLIRLIGGGGAGSGGGSNRIEEGSKVEGNYRGKGKWFPGKITRDRGDHTFDIAYDDGESETQVDELLIRLIGGGGAGSGGGSKRIEEGSKVEGNYRGKGKWFPGKITRDRGDHTFDIAYDDGESETRVDELLIRLIGGGGAGSGGGSKRIEEGSKVEGNYRGKGKWFPGKITRDRGDHTFDVAYDDGESETRVDELLIRLIGGGGAGSGGGSNRIEEGSKVEGNYRGKGKWFPGKITRDRGDHTFDIAYDDGESETRVDELLIRLIGGGGAGSGGGSKRIEEGSKVEGNYRGKGKWFPGKITRDRGDHTFDIAYDDGESETRVDELLIRLIGGGVVERGGMSPEAGRRFDRGLSRDISRDRARSRSSEAKMERSFLLPHSVRVSLQSVVKRCQQVSVDGTARKMFESNDDTPPSGFVTKKEFKKVLKDIYHLGKPRNAVPFDDWIEDEDFESLLAALCHNKKGTIAYDEFIAFALDSEESDEVIDVHEKLRKEIFNRSKLKFKDLIKNFSTSKTFAKGYVRNSEFQNIIRKLTPKLSSKEVEALVAYWDQEKEGTVDFHSFAVWAHTGHVPDEVITKFLHQMSMLSSKSIESELEDSISKGNNTSTKFNERSFFDAMLALGLVLSGCDCRGVFLALDPEGKGAVSIDDVMDCVTKGKSREPRERGSRRSRSNSKLDDEFYLVPRAAQDDLSDATRSYLKSSGAACVGKLFQDQMDETKALKLSRKQLRKGFSALGALLSDSDEALIFEALDFRNENCVAVEDVLSMCMDYALEGDDVEVSQALRQTLEKRKVPPKELHRALVKIDVQRTGFVDHKMFEKCFLKLCGGEGNVKADYLADIERYFDPTKDGKLDLNFVTSMATLCGDVSRAESKLKNFFKVMRVRGVDYRAAITKETGADAKVVDSEDFLRLLSTSFGLPILKSELQLITGKYQKRGRINVESFLEAFESASDKVKTSDAKILLTKDENFGKVLFKKICKLRTNDVSRREFRKSVIAEDPDMVGFISRKKLQRVLDSKVDFTESEAALLIENLSFPSGLHKDDVDYSLLLLFLAEPVRRNALSVAAGSAAMNKMMRGADSTALKRFLSQLFRSFSASDPRALGVIPFLSAEKILKEECQAVDSKFLAQVLEAFQDNKSDCIQYPEMISFLSNCSLWSVMDRIHYIDIIRQKQGYNFGEFLKKYAAKKGQKIDASKLSEQMLAIGILVPETAMSTIFSHFGGKGGYSSNLDVGDFVQAIADTDSEIMKIEQKRADIKPYKADKADPGSADDVSTLILNDYDERVIRAVQQAYDIFDTQHKNEIQAVELERVLCSLGQAASMDDITDLIFEIDPKNTGMLGFNNFITHVIPYLRARYKRAASLSLERLKVCFDKLDLNGDGTLNIFEFKHIVSSPQNAFTRLTSEESEQLLEFLDIDKDKCISWDEFKSVFKTLGDLNAFEALPHTVGKALRKIQYSNLPDPFMYINLFVGLPFNYRRSVLADISLVPQHRLEQLVCCNPANEAVVVAPDMELQFEVQVVRVSGVPSEAESRKDDVLHRTVRFMICRTDKPPSTQEPGSPPEFLGNVTKLHATVHPSRPDTWQFSNKEEMDPDKSCFVRCSATESYKGESNETSRKSSGLEELYLFVELITTLRVPVSELRGLGRGMGRGEIGSYDKERRGDDDIPHGKGKSSERGEDRSRERDRDRSRDRDGNKSPTRGDTVRDSADMPNLNGTGTHTITPKKSADVTKSATFMSRFSSKRAADSLSKSTNGFPSRSTKDDLQSDVDDVGDETPRVRGRDRAPLDSRKRGSSAEKNTRRSADGPRSRERGESPRIRKDREFRDFDSDLDDDFPEDEPLVVVEMCSGWAMIPVAATLRGTVRKLRLPMCGGTPFAVVNIQGEDVPRRAGVWNSMKRLMGITQPSILEILITPAATAPSMLAKASAAVTIPRPPLPAPIPTPTPNPPENQKAASIPNPLLLKTNRLTSLLPPNVILPTSSLSIVGIYRIMLLKSFQVSLENADRQLPQTGTLHSSSALLSGFPKLIADQAVYRVLMQMWSKEAPSELVGKTGKDITIGIAANQKASDVFKEVVLRVWRASNSPDAQPDKLCPIESIEALYVREMRIRDMVGLSRPGGAVNSSQTLNLSTAGPRSALGATGGPGIGVGSSVNISSSLSLTGMFGRTSTRNITNGENNDNVLNVTGNIPNGSSTGNKNVGPSRLERIPLGEQLHTPFNARELMWNGQSLI